jgi:hypothetical protein
MACCALTPASASAVLNARRKLWKSTGNVVAVSKYRGSRGFGAGRIGTALFLPRSVRVPGLT